MNIVHEGDPMACLDTHAPASITFSYFSFCTAVSLAALGIICLPRDLWMRGYLVMAALFLVHASISLIETLRDRHETDRPAMPSAEIGR